MLIIIRIYNGVYTVRKQKYYYTMKEMYEFNNMWRNLQINIKVTRK